MATADVVMEKALDLARNDATSDGAIHELLALVGEHRVAAVRARQRLMETIESHPDDQAATRAAALLEGVLDRLPV
jgi:hypothetical protein